MPITFVQHVDVADTMVFDDVYEPALRLTLAEKSELLPETIAVWLLSDGRLAGEIYGLSPKRMWDAFAEDLENTDPSDADSLYVFSTTVLPEFRGCGYATLLKAYYQGFVTARGYRSITGHATSPAMVRINEKFGATFGAVYPNWYGTARVARFYRITL